MPLLPDYPTDEAAAAADLNLVKGTRQGLAEHFDADAFLASESMAALVRENLRQISKSEKRDPSP